MGLKSFFSKAAVSVFGLMIAIAGLGLLGMEYQGGAEHARTSHIIMYVIIFGLGLLIVSPGIVGGAANKLIVLVMDAKKGGMRWTDPPADGAAKPKSPPKRATIVEDEEDRPG